MITFAEFRKHWWRLKTKDSDDIFDVMGANLSAATKTAILTDLTPPVEAAKAAHRQTIEDGIRANATELLPDDPLRVAIQGAP